MIEPFAYSLFLYDTLLSNQASMVESQNIKNSFVDYTIASRQLINNLKSKILFMNVSPLVQEKLRVLEFRSWIFPF